MPDDDNPGPQPLGIEHAAAIGPDAVPLEAEAPVEHDRRTTYAAEFQDGKAEVLVDDVPADVLGVGIVTIDDGELAPATFEAADVEDYPGTARVSITAEIGDGPASVQVTTAV